MRSKILKRISWGLLLIGLLWGTGSYLASVFSTRSAPAEIASAHKHFDFPVEEISLRAQDGVHIQAWWLPNPSSTRALILLNGLRGNRSGLIQRARLYHAEGYCVLLPDLRGTGESERSVITFGWKERWDLMAAVEFIRQKGIQRIAAHGLSLGAATICYSLPEEPGFEYIVLESCYDNIQQALNNRLDMFGLPHWPFIGLQKITEWRIGAKAEQLAPEKYLATHQAPTLLIAGEAELKVRKEESEKLYRQCAAKQKKLHLIEGAKHENFMTRFAEETTQVLQQWIRQMEAQEPID